MDWQPRHTFENGLEATVRCYLEQQGWCCQVHERGAYTGKRHGVIAMNQ